LDEIAVLSITRQGLGKAERNQEKLIQHRDAQRKRIGTTLRNATGRGGAKKETSAQGWLSPSRHAEKKKKPRKWSRTQEGERDLKNVDLGVKTGLTRGGLKKPLA